MKYSICGHVFEDDFWHISNEMRTKSHLAIIAKPPAPGERKFFKKANATKPKKRK